MADMHKVCQVVCTEIVKGQVFGRYTVIGSKGVKRKLPQSNHIYYECECDCGNISWVLKSNLLRGYSQGCRECQRMQMHAIDKYSMRRRRCKVLRKTKPPTDAVEGE